MIRLGDFSLRLGRRNATGSYFDVVIFLINQGVISFQFIMQDYQRYACYTILCIQYCHYKIQLIQIINCSPHVIELQYLNAFSVVLIDVMLFKLLINRVHKP